METAENAESALTDGACSEDFPFSAIAAGCGDGAEAPTNQLAKSGAECGAYHSCTSTKGAS